MHLLLLYGSFLATTLFAGHLLGLAVEAFLQPVPIGLVLFPTLAVVLYLAGPSGTLELLKRMGKSACTPTDVETIDRACTASLIFAGMGMLMGFIQAMSNLTDSSILGAAIATSFISFFYGLVPSALALGVRVTASNPANQSLQKRRLRIAGFVTLGTLSYLLVFFVVMFNLKK